MHRDSQAGGELVDFDDVGSIDGLEVFTAEDFSLDDGLSAVFVIDHMRWEHVVLVLVGSVLEGDSRTCLSVFHALSCGQHCEICCVTLLDFLNRQRLPQKLDSSCNIDQQNRNYSMQSVVYVCCAFNGSRDVRYE